MEPLISTEELAAALADGQDDLLVFDCTVFLRRSDDGPYIAEPGRAAFAEGHIPGSGFIDQVAELSDPDSELRFTALPPDGLAAAFAARGVGDGRRVVLYDRAFNMWATRAWWLLHSIGFDDVAVLDGGWRAWTTDGRDVSTDPEPTVSAAQLTPTPRPGMIVDRAEVEAATGDAGVCLVNSLSAQIHDGTDVSYGRPGHIPSSRNVFAVDLCDPETHRYKPLDELRDLFGAADVGGDRIITWCGGGIAATSDAFTLLRLGHRAGEGGVGIYDGSLSEWVAADLPLEVG